MSRTKAVANITQEDFVKSMEGIVCDTDALVRDEAPAAYKDLTTVMANQVKLPLVSKPRSELNIQVVALQSSTARHPCVSANLTSVHLPTIASCQPWDLG